MSDERFRKRGDVDFCIAHVVEECGEVLAAAGKSQRWGLDSTNPLIEIHLRETNRVWLRRELHDLAAAIDRLLQCEGMH